MRVKSYGDCDAGIRSLVSCVMARKYTSLGPVSSRRGLPLRRKGKFMP